MPAFVTSTRSDNSTGVLFLVVGPSGVGKDTLIDAARETLGDTAPFVFAGRVVTRPREAGGEAHEAMTEAAFAKAEADGEFAVTWGAHALRYGVSHDALAPLAARRNVVVNVSRTAIDAFAALASQVVVLAVTAPADVVRARLEARGREDAADVAARLARDVPMTGALSIVAIDNGGDLASGTGRFVSALLQLARLPLVVRRLPFDPQAGPLAFVHRRSLPILGRQVVIEEMAQIVAPGRTVVVRLATADDDRLVTPADIALPPTVLDRLAVPEGSEVLVRAAGPSVSVS